jgi:hypothetical protein
VLLLVLCGRRSRRLAEGGFDVREGVGATGDSLLARLAVPDTGGVTLDGVLAAEGAEVAGVLRDFNLLHLLTERGTITGVLVSRCSWSVGSQLGARVY